MHMQKSLVARLASVTAFVLFGATAANAATLLLAWDANPEPVSGYILYWGTQPGQYTQSLNVGKTTQATVTTSVANATVYFVVKAYNSNGLSAPSPQVAAWIGIVSRTPTLTRPGDFDGDGKADPVIYRGTTGDWFSSSAHGIGHVQWGSPAAGDIPVAADYDGDGKTDYAVYRSSTGQWFIDQSHGGLRTVSWGSPALQDIPVPADYDGDGKVDIAVFRRATGEWFILKSTTGAMKKVTWGAVGNDDVPVPSDYDGTGKADVAIYRRSTGQWFVLFDNSSTAVYNWGSASTADIPVPADYDGDGKTDYGIFRETNGTWILHLSANNGTKTLAFGSPVSGDIPVPADFDGDGKADIAIFRPTTATWYIAYAVGGNASFNFGSAALGDTMGGLKEVAVLPLQ
jgi:hypothetical protein